MASTWKEFWNKKHKIYVSQRHIDTYYKVLGDDILRLLPSKRPLTLLDWGCGEALATQKLTSSGIDVFLYDPVPRAHESISRRFKDVPRIHVININEQSNILFKNIDVVLIHSVLQYISKKEFRQLLLSMQKTLRPGSTVLFGDIVPPSLSMFSDLFELLQAGIIHGFFFAALRGMVATFFSNYRMIRKKNGFTTYTEGEMSEILRQHGFNAERLENIGLSTHRMLIRGIRAGRNQ